MSTSRHVALAKQNARAAQEARHVRNVRKMNRSQRDELVKVREENIRAVKSVKRDYYLQLSSLKERQGVVVKKLQTKIIKAVNFENQRAKKTITELRTIHNDQIIRLRATQEGQLQSLRDEHQIQLDNAIRKYKLEREKFEPATAKEKR
ncbi:MAG: hypothetical protein E2O68_05960 [Deltaproteobacteria bacterium]|nr:MAG: hypothetical protein E2O68_05960 [Deltaproteobacteria bacterium]